MEYYLLPSFKDSQEYFEKAYKKYAALDNSQQIQLIYNYTSLLTASEQYNSVINLLNKHGGIFLQTPYENSISLFSIMAHIYIGDIKHLRDLMPNINDINSKDTEIYMRIIECIILYYEDNYEICLTNLENIYNTSRYNQDLDQAYIDFSKIFQRFIIAKLIFDKAERAKKLDKCKSLSDKFINAYKLGFGSNMLCSVWLNKEIEKSLLD